MRHSRVAITPGWPTTPRTSCAASYTPGGAGVDGIAELRFRNRDDFEHRFYDSDEGRDIIRQDVKQFIARPSGQAALMHELQLRQA